MADVLPFTGQTVVPIPPENVLDGAKDAALSSVLVVGRHENGSLYLAASHSEMGELLLMVERAKQRLLEIAE